MATKTKKPKCPNCHGRGHIRMWGAAPHNETCEDCGGTGVDAECCPVCYQKAMFNGGWDYCERCKRTVCDRCYASRRCDTN